MLITILMGFFITWLFNNKNLYLLFISLICLILFKNILYIGTYLVMILVMISFFSFYGNMNLKTSICFILFLFSSLSMMMANSTLILWLNMEIQSFSMMLMSLFGEVNKMNKVEALMKYFFISLTASLLLVGYQSMILMNSNTSSVILSGTLSMEKFIIFLFYTMIMFKLGGFPFNFWVPEVYGSLSMKNLFVFIIMPKMTFLIMFLKFSLWHNFLLMVGGFSMLVGSLNMMNQNSIKKMMAWSSVSNLGFMILCLSENPVKTNFSFFMFSSIYFSTLLILTLFLMIKNKNLIIEFINMFLKEYLMSVMILIVFLSFLGLPPLAGFFSKMLVFLNLLSSSSLFMSMTLMSMTLMSAFAYLSIMNLSINSSKKNFFYWKSSKELVSNNYLLLLALSYFIMFWFLNPNMMMMAIK